ncbi:MAG: GxxExxY protein [Muribaculaceae bacterium]|nr:GxxExxY protein [Muribaculaceae bacterium]MDE6027714.1 GxxExxY protein [Muribaculaceae bacterium]
METLIQLIKDAAFEVRKNLSPGYLEKVYQKALMFELELRGLQAQMEKPLNIFYKGVKVGDYFADIVVEDKVIVEVKAVSELTTAHEVQLVNYLCATGLDWGLLVNYGSSTYRIMKKSRLYSPNHSQRGSKFS